MELKGLIDVASELKKKDKKIKQLEGAVKKYENVIARGAGKMSEVRISFSCLVHVHAVPVVYRTLPPVGNLGQEASTVGCLPNGTAKRIGPEGSSPCHGIIGRKAVCRDHQAGYFKFRLDFSSVTN